MRINHYLIALACALALTSCDKKQQDIKLGDDEFAVETVKSSTADLQTTYSATMKGEEVSEIRAKVSGHITKVYVKEGATVHKGQPLFAIDNVQYASGVKQAQAAVNVIKTNLATQRLALENKKMLHDKQIISDFDYQMAQNNLAALEAQLGQAEAALTSAKDQLSFCTVTSPANGVVGEIPYRVGSLVGPTTVQPLTTVASTATMYAYFSMTEKQLLSMTREHGTKDAAVKAFPAVTLKLTDGSVYEHEGHIEAISGVVDANTGSVQIRADFKNPQSILRSGGTATVVIPTHVDNAIIVPQSATYKIQEKTFCYTVDKDNMIHNTEIQVLQQENGKDFVVTSGLSVGDRIMVEGLSKVKDGQKIIPITREQSAKKLDKAKKHMEEKKMPNAE